MTHKPNGNDYHVNAFTFAGLDEITALNVGRFAKALANKLLAAKEKYGYTDGWAQPDWEEQCRASLLEHIHKGDPIDVAAFAMFMWKHNWSTASPSLKLLLAERESLEKLVEKWREQAHILATGEPDFSDGLAASREECAEQLSAILKGEKT